MASARKHRLTRIFMLLLVLLCGAALLVQSWMNLGQSADERLVTYERWARRTAFTFGQTLPGTPDLTQFSQRLADKGVTKGAPIFVRIFKREFDLELWMLKDGQFRLFETYPICRWSGWLGPKHKQGDRQAPEGFYTVDAKALNPQSRWHRSFNLGFPNAFDRAHGRTGSFIMVHGGCSSVGCFAMTNPVIDEIWDLVTAALNGGQPRFQVQVFPFRMTKENLDARASDPQAAFWNNLKGGYDLFEKTRTPPRVDVCKNRYVFDAAGSAINGSTPIGTRCPTAKQAN